MDKITDADLISFMDEGLSPSEMVRVEKELRRDNDLSKKFQLLRQARDKGWHSVGAIWRAHRLSCPTRSQLGSYLLDALDPNWQDYITFHLKMVGCRICNANLEDLRSKQSESTTRKARRSKFFKSSIGRLQSDD